MELKGKIDDYGIADIFQLIGQQRRSGILTVRSDNNVAEVIFVQGMISRAHPAYSVPRENPFGMCAVKAGLIGEKNLQKALAVQEETLKTLEEISMEMQFLDQLTIQKINDFLLSETLYDVFKWKSGEYEFAMKEVDHDERFYDLVSVDHIMLDILRMIDEEPDLLRRISDFNSIVQKTSSVDEEKVYCLSSDGEEETYEGVVYGFIDGQNTVRNIIDQSLLGRYHTLNALVSLFEAGLIMMVSAEPAFPERRLGRRKELLTHLSYSFIPAVLLIMVIVKALTFEMPTLQEVKEHFFPMNFVKTRLPRVSNALNAYYLGRGNYPASLATLVEAGLLKDADLISPRGTAYAYKRLTPDSYQLD